ncbi:peptide-methionine (S)-S-oxide reductase MsrA [Candidatus Berkelbacteria bacterium]|nr:peptide-methionine (S)-S-oxide reductase MsrA [Candidatus Berkelbacteria bacterium]
MAAQSQTAVFGGGCFWCTETVFKRLRGVIDVHPGYAGGTRENPSYFDLHYRNTGEAEAIQITFDPDQISYRNLLDVFFGTHDPTSLNQQDNDKGPEYRSAIFTVDEHQRAVAETYKRQLQAEKTFDKPIVTAIEPLTKFYPAEPDHKDFYDRNRQSAYCRIIIDPKIVKLRQKFAHLLKENA